jgi:hypothetical protein
LIDVVAIGARAKELVGPGINGRVALIVAFSELEGSPLDPEGFDSSAVILRAETLMLDCVELEDAVKTAREEFATWATS